MEDNTHTHTHQEPETKICKDENCPHKGVPQPIDKFSRHHYAGRLDMCKSCMSKRISAGHMKKQKKKHSDGTEKLYPGKMDHAGGPIELNKLNLIDELLSGHDDLLKHIKKIASDEERTPEGQVRYFLKTDTRIIGELRK